MKYPNSSDDTCFNVDVIDEVTEEELDALLDDSKPFLSTSEKISDADSDREFEEFMEVKFEEEEEEETTEEEEKFEEIIEIDQMKIKSSLEEPPTDLELKRLPKNLEYAYLEENSLLPVVISSSLETIQKEKLVSVLKKHKRAFA